MLQAGSIKKSPAGTLFVTISTKPSEDQEDDDEDQGGDPAESGDEMAALRAELEQERAHRKALAEDQRRLLAVVRTLEEQLGTSDSNAETERSEERRRRSLGMMARMVANFETDDVKRQFYNWKVCLYEDAMAEKEKNASDELQALKERAAMQKGKMAMDKMINGAKQKAFTSWKDVYFTESKLRAKEKEMEAAAAADAVQGLKGKTGLEKMQYIMKTMSQRELKVAVQNWQMETSRDKIANELLQAEQFAKEMSKDELNNEKLRIIVKQWVMRKAVRAVSTWQSNIFKERSGKAVQASSASRKNYEVLCQKILRLDRSVLTHRAQLVIRWARRFKEQAFLQWKDMMTGHVPYETRVQLEEMRRNASGSFHMILRKFGSQNRLASMQGAWSNWRSFLTQQMMSQHVQMVEKLWARQQAQSEEIESMKAEAFVGQNAIQLQQEAVKLRQENSVLRDKTKLTLSEADEVASSLQKDKEQLRSAKDHFEGECKILLSECDEIKRAALTEQEEFITLFKAMAEQRRSERKTAIINLLKLFGRRGRGEAFARWRSTTSLAQLRAALKLIDSANDQLRKVIEHVGHDKNETPELKRKLSAAEKERKELRSAVERNSQYTQALIANLSFLRSALPELSATGDAFVTSSRNSRGNRNIPKLVDDILSQAQLMSGDVTPR